MSRRASLWVLAGTALAVGAFFFHVIRAFLMPLFLAIVLALLFYPMYEAAVRWCRGWRRPAALLTIFGILVIVFLPVGSTLFLAGQEMLGLAKKWVPSTEQENGRLQQHLLHLKQNLNDDEYSRLRQGVLEGRQPTAVLPAPIDPTLNQSIAKLEHDFSQEKVRYEMRTMSLGELVEPENSSWVESVKARLDSRLPERAYDRLNTSVKGAFSDLFSQVYRKTRDFVANTATVVVGFAVMLVALYYFFVDGPEFVDRMETLLPLESGVEQALFRQFDDICRGVVLGTVVAAAVQAALLGIGLAVAGVERVWLLAGLTLICSMIPLLGSATIYVPVSIFLLTQQRYLAAALLLAYGGGVVSTSDNFVRAYVLHGRSRLHPLVAFVSMLGGLEAIGLWGIFLGPIVAGFFYSLLKILHQRLEGKEIVTPPGEEIASDRLAAPAAAETGREQKIAIPP